MDHAIDISKDNLRIDDLAPSIAKLALNIGGVGLIAAVVLGFFDGEAFFRGYIMNFVFVMSLALGALFFVVLQHLTRAGWSVTVRRIPEHILAAFPIMFVLFLPILFAMWAGWWDLDIAQSIQRTYPWLDRAMVEKDHILHLKVSYLNMGFFTIRILIYFGLWIWIANHFRGSSLEQDRTGDASITERLQVRAAPCMLAYALTSTFFAFDILMSLNPLWFSTIFGVYYFAGTALCIFATMTIVLMILQSSGRVTQAVTTEHFHDLGKLIFAFTVFWAYIGFSQYMLIWYANLPEETQFYVAREQNPVWRTLMFILLFGHFVLPFLLIISRNVKRQPTALFAAAVWMLVMHWLDMAFLVVPHAESMDAATGKLVSSELSASQVVQCVLCLVGIGGVFVWAVLSRIGSESLVPLRDPRLQESLAFENA